MIKIEAETIELAYSEAATRLTCSVTELNVEVIQSPSNGILGFFKKSAIIVATCTLEGLDAEVKETPAPAPKKTEAPKVQPSKKERTKSVKPQNVKPIKKAEKKSEVKPQMLNDTMLPESFVTDQDEMDEEDNELLNHNYAYATEDDDLYDDVQDLTSIAAEVKVDINRLFDAACFSIDTIEVSVYDDNTLLVEFSGDDAALLIGKEGYRYKALSYMIFNWINAKYQMQLRLEIAEFLKNQEESIERYLTGVCESINRDGRAQTKVLDGVLVQIALKQLRSSYPDKYVAIRSTRDGAKYIIVNHYNEH